MSESVAKNSVLQSTGSNEEPYCSDEPESHNRKKYVIGFVIFVIIACAICYFVLDGKIKSHGAYADSDTSTTSPVTEQEAPVDSSNVEESWEQVTFDGEMYDAKGYFGNIQIGYETDGNNARNCVYKNVDLGGKIKMDVDITDDSYSFSGKDGRNAFTFTVSKDKLYGEGMDGKKELLVFLYPEGEEHRVPKYDVQLALYDQDTDAHMYMNGRSGYYEYFENEESHRYILRLLEYEPGGTLEIEAYSRGELIGVFKGNYESETYNGRFYATDGGYTDFHMGNE